MNPTTPDDLFELIDRYVAAAAVGAAMEHGLFWLLAEKPRGVVDVATTLGIPEDRCRPWLQLIAELGFLDHVSEGYVASLNARVAILDSYSRETWSFLAREARERFPAVRDLAVQLREPGTPWEAQQLTAPDYFTQLQEKPGRAREFTRMLYEIHVPLAEELAASLPMDGVERLLDVGGGSGVMSFALLRRSPGLEAVVLDIANVCDAGREIAAENSLQDRIEYQVCDFVIDELPAGFDMVLYCDVGRHDEALFRKLHSALSPGGVLVIVNKFGAETGLAHPSRAHWALLASLSGPAPQRLCVEDVQDMLRTAGFEKPSATELPNVASRWSNGWTRILARA
ncbi:MAG: class I SAM-dependent methyltransferase [Acidimicrobiia bacterium]